jgi:type II secretory pathway component PulJ
MNRNHRAFILLELIVALTILGFGFSVLFASMSGSTRNIERLEKFQRREQRAENLLTELDLVQSLKPGDSARGSFDDGTRWRIEAEPFVRSVQDASILLRIQLRLEWDGKSGTQVRTIETYRLARNPITLVRSLDDQLHELQ